MKLGIIGGWTEDDFRHVADFGLHNIEFCVNVGRDAEEIASHAEEILAYSEKYDVRVASIGRWGTDRLNADGSINRPEFAADCALIGMAAKLGCPVFNLGVNGVKDMAFIDNINAAIAYLRELKKTADEKGVKLALYNCDWGNIIFDKRGWDLVLPAIDGIGIKYDTSHCLNRGGDILQEMLDYGRYIYHFHVKGTLRVNGKHIDDPPAGLDTTPWGAVMELLYYHDYKGTLSIEPHSSVWIKGTRADWGVRFTRDYISKFILENDGDDGSVQYMP